MLGKVCWTGLGASVRYWRNDIPILPIVLCPLIVLFNDDGILRKGIPIRISLSIKLAEGKTRCPQDCRWGYVHTALVQRKQVLFIGHRLTTIGICIDMIG